MAISLQRSSDLWSGIGSDAIASPFWDIAISHHGPWNSLFTPTYGSLPSQQFFFTSNVQCFKRSYLHVMHCLSSTGSRSAASLTAKKPSVYCFIDPYWTKGGLVSIYWEQRVFFFFPTSSHIFLAALINACVQFKTNATVKIVIMWPVYSLCSHPRYSVLLPLNGTSAYCICGAGATAGNQVCCNSETRHFLGRVFKRCLTRNCWLSQTCSGRITTLWFCIGRGWSSPWTLFGMWPRVMDISLCQVDK